MIMMRHLGLIRITIGLTLLAAVGLAFPQGAPPAPPADISNLSQSLSGTLFFSREQRERMDRARQRGEHLEVDGLVLAPERPPVINGFVKRSDGKTTMWVDGERLNDTKARLTDRVQPVDVGGGDDEKRVRLTGESEPKPQRPRASRKGRPVAGSKAKLPPLLLPRAK
jgi:hypothetical protein